MIDISLGKLVLLALIALIVLGPEKLPEVARTAGALLRRLRGSWDSVRTEVERELQIEEIKRTAREAAARAEAAQSELDNTLKQVRQPFTDAADKLGDADAALRSGALMRPLSPKPGDQTVDPSTGEAPPSALSAPDQAKPPVPAPGAPPHDD